MIYPILIPNANGLLPEYKVVPINEDILTAYVSLSFMGRVMLTKTFFRFQPQERGRHRREGDFYG